MLISTCLGSALISQGTMPMPCCPGASTTTLLNVSVSPSFFSKRAISSSPDTNLVVTTPYTLTTYAYCTGPVSTENVSDATRQSRTVNRYTITSTGLTPRARIIATGLSTNVNYSFSCKIKYNGGVIPSWYIDSSKGNPEGSNNTFNSRTQTFVDIGNGWYQFTEKFNFASCSTGGSWSNFGFAAPNASFLNQTFDVYDIQFEQNAITTPYVNGTRSNTQAIVDLTGTSTITASSLTYNSNGTFSFNGTSNYMDCGNSAAVQLSTAITMEAWVNPVSTTGLGNIMSKNFNSGYRFRIDNGSLWWYVSGNSITGGSVPNGSWSHCVVTGSSAGLNSYVNGVLVASNSTAFAPAAPTLANLYIGTYGPSSEPFNGTIAVAKIYNQALTAAEVKQNFNALRGRYGL